MDCPMLIDFEVENFRSFGERRVFSMLANSKIQDHKDHVVASDLLPGNLLRTGVIYGPNAAGKSNLIRAAEFAKRTLLSLPEAGKSIPVRPFSTAEFEGKPSTFQFRFLVGGHVVTYGFELVTERVVSEWLSVWMDETEVDVFSRQDDQITRNPRLGSFVVGEIEITVESLGALEHLGIRSNQLLLSKLFDLPDEKKGDLIRQIEWWFRDCLHIVCPQANFSGLLRTLDEDPDFLRFAETFLETVDTGINRLEIERTPLDIEDLPHAFAKDLEGAEELRFGDAMSFSLNPDNPLEVVRRNIFSGHGGENGFRISFEEESDGTRRILDLLPALYLMQKNCSVFLIDELDRSLHPQLSRAFLQFFLESCPRSCRQLIVTTHELHLLDQNLLRRDEVWLVEKDRSQQTNLASLSDLESRNDRKLAKNYLQGRFGGIPHIRDTEKLQDMLDCERAGADA